MTRCPKGSNEKTGIRMPARGNGILYNASMIRERAGFPKRRELGDNVKPPDVYSTR
jgi:hypothetical protein